MLGNMTTNEQHIISDGYIMSMGFTLPTSSLIATYVKNGVTYSEPIPPCADTYITISDANVTEGDSGTKTMSFTVSLVNPPAGAGSNDKTDLYFTTTAATATSGVDYVSLTNYTANNLVVGDFPYTVDVTINGDTLVEDNETFYIDMTIGENDLNAVLVDSRGIGTIIDDDNGSGVTPPISAAYANVDVVDGYSGSGAGYNSWITTKVSAKPNMQLSAVYLGNDENNPVPQPYSPAGNANQAASITILYKLVDMSSGATCQNAPHVELTTILGGNTPVISVIDPGETSQVSNAFVMGYVESGTNIPLSKQNVKVKYKSVDFNQLIIDSGIQCAQRSSTGGVAEGIPSCLIAQNNNDSQAIQNYKTIFGEAAYTSCYTENGEPCAASNGGWGAYPYDHEYGCFECSIGGFPYVCSNDNFAIRPNQFAIDSTDVDFPNLLRSAEDYNLTVYAYDYGVTSGTDGSDDYNITSATSIFDLNTTKYNKNGVIDVSMFGTAVWSAYDFNISNGVSWSSAAVGSEVAGTKFDDVGKINLQVIDDNWAAVDINNPNDPTPHDCTANAAYICGNKDITYIPHHFDFADLNVTNNNGNPGTFTYIANELSQMAGRIDTRMRALNADGNVTKNFATFPLWENNVTVVPVVTTSKYIYTDANETNITNLAINFGIGEKTIAWNENNTSQYLRFNFQRDVNLTANPFDVNGSDLNITIASHYVDPADGDTADITGARAGTIQPGGGNVIFIYGRTHASRQRYQGNTGTANIYFESFCFGAGCDKTLLNGFSPNLIRTDDTRWFWNENHNTTNDGNIGTVQQKDATPLNAADDVVDVTAQNNAANPSTATLLYNGSRGYPYKTTMHNDASPWLIYNKSDPTAIRNEFQVEFDMVGDWTGEHETNTTTKTPAGATTNRRIMW